MKQYKVKVDVSAGYLVDIEAATPEEAAAKVSYMSKRAIQAGEFFVNLDQRVTEVWEDGDTVLTVQW